jgi:large subunit ribosomal protein L35
MGRTEATTAAKATGESCHAKNQNQSIGRQTVPQTGSGKFAFSKSHHNHILTKKSTKRKRTLRQPQLIKASDIREVRRLLPNG